MCLQGGDIVNDDGTGGESIYGATFPDEGFLHKHDEAGLLSMANIGPDTNSSQFFITLKATPWIDEFNVVFGKIVEGMEVVRKMEECGNASGDFPQKIVISNCGEC